MSTIDEVDFFTIRDKIEDFAVSLKLQPSLQPDEHSFMLLYVRNEIPLDAVIGRHYDFLRERPLLIVDVAKLLLFVVCFCC